MTQKVIVENVEMEKISKLLELKEEYLSTLDDKIYNSLLVLRKYLEVDKSYNGKFTTFKYNKNTKLIIVGTITPPETDFYYCKYSKKPNYNTLNYLFDYYKDKVTLIEDERYKEDINNLKKDLANDKNNKNYYIDLLINALNDRGVLFLDVVKKVLRPASSKDADFVCLSLDWESFLEPLKDFFAKDSSLKIVTNSLDAEGYFKKIIKKVNVKTGSNYKFKENMKNYKRLTQITRGEKMKNKNKEERGELLSSL